MIHKEGVKENDAVLHTLSYVTKCNGTTHPRRLSRKQDPSNSISLLANHARRVKDFIAGELDFRIRNIGFEGGWCSGLLTVSENRQSSKR